MVIILAISLIALLIAAVLSAVRRRTVNRALWTGVAINLLALACLYVNKRKGARRG